MPSGSTPALAAPEFAKQLHSRWGVGDAACHNGVLLLLAVEDRQVYINTGAGGALRGGMPLLGTAIAA